MTEKFKLGQRVYIVETDSDRESRNGSGEKSEAQKGKWGTVLFVEDNAYDLPYQVLTEDHKSAHWYEEDWLRSEDEYKLETQIKNLGFGVGDTVLAIYNGTEGFRYILVVDDITERGIYAGTGLFPLNVYKFTKVTKGYWTLD